MNAPDYNAEIEAKDGLIRRNRQARAILSLLMMAMAEDGPPTEEVVHDAIDAAQELLAV